MSYGGFESEDENVQETHAIAGFGNSLPSIRSGHVAAESVDYSADFITDERWSDREAMLSWASKAGLKTNTTLIIMRSWKSTPAGRGRVILGCEKSGEPRSGKRKLSVGEVQTWKSRKGSTKKTGCPFLLDGDEISPNTWQLTVKCGRHNHVMSPTLEGHLYEGRLKENQNEEGSELSRAGAATKAKKRREIIAPVDESMSQRDEVKLPHLSAEGFDLGRGNFEMFMCIYVERVKDVERDGNCGFRALAELLGIGESIWPMIRKHMHHEVLDHEDRYAPLIERRGETVMTYRSKLNWQVLGMPAPLHFWMHMPISGTVFATVYQCTLVFLDYDGAVTCLPLTRQEPAPGAPLPGRVLVLCRLRSQEHYVAVWLRSEKFPMPPILGDWRDFHDASVEGMDEQYASRIEEFNYLRIMHCRPPPL